MSQRVLIIAHWFPPAGGIAVQRALSLARYLPQHGFEVHVLSPRNPPSPVLDPALCKRVPPEVVSHRAWTPSPNARLRKRLWGLVSRGRQAPAQQNPDGAARPSSPSGLSTWVRRLLSPDPEVVWVPFALRRARRIVRRYGIGTVIVTAPPFSAFLIGNALKREFPSLKLISDFRDEWLRFFLSTFDYQKNSQIRQRAERIERATVEGSDAVVTVTPSLVEELRERYRDLPAGKFVLIPNGYDPALFENFTPRPHEGSKIIVTYVGTVYSTVSPECYFAALDRLPEALRHRIETHFVGRIAGDQQHLVESRPDVKVFGYVPQREALRRMEETDYLLLIMKDPTHVTGKIYEYLATGKPIVAFSPPGGEVDHTLRETRAGWCLDPEDEPANSAFLERLANGELAGNFDPDLVAIRRYDRTHLVGEFAALIQALSAPAGSSPVRAAVS
jgi:glycosyltransferase involved in cell wall biosynthesis